MHSIGFPHSQIAWISRFYRTSAAEVNWDYCCGMKFTWRFCISPSASKFLILQEWMTKISKLFSISHKIAQTWPLTSHKLWLIIHETVLGLSWLKTGSEIDFKNKLFWSWMTRIFFMFINENSGRVSNKLKDKSKYLLWFQLFFGFKFRPTHYLGATWGSNMNLISQAEILKTIL